MPNTSQAPRSAPRNANTRPKLEANWLASTPTTATSPNRVSLTPPAFVALLSPPTAPSPRYDGCGATDSDARASIIVHDSFSARKESGKPPATETSVASRVICTPTSADE
eukprot:6178333-Pleurochrysis_carterae.AAC.3